jgi:hypothetical protein
LAPLVSTIDITRPQDEVFSYVTDPTTFAEWQAGVVGGSIEGGTRPAVGSKCMTTRRIGRKERESTSEVTKLEPPTCWAVHGIDGPIEAECEISGRVVRTVIRDGLAKVAEGRLTLSRSDGEVIVEAPLSEIRADNARFSFGGAARVWIGGDSYALTPLRVRRAAPGTPGGEAFNLTRDIQRLRKGKELTQLFLAAVEAEGGRLGDA